MNNFWISFVVALTILALLFFGPFTWLVGLAGVIGWIKGAVS